MTVVPSPTRDMILNSSISRRMPGEAQAQAVGGRIAASIASEDVADPGALVEGDDLDTFPRPILDQPENDLALGIGAGNVRRPPPRGSGPPLLAREFPSVKFGDSPPPSIR